MTEVAAYTIPDSKTTVYISHNEIFRSAAAFRKYLRETRGFSEAVALHHAAAIASSKQVSESEMLELLCDRGMRKATAAALLKPSKTKKR